MHLLSNHHIILTIWYHGENLCVAIAVKLWVSIHNVEDYLGMEDGIDCHDPPSIFVFERRLR